VLSRKIYAMLGLRSAVSGGRKPSPVHPYAHLSENELRALFLQDPFSVLRKKWSEVPGASDRYSTQSLLAMSDDDLLRNWESNRHAAVTGANFSVRGWYHLLYRDVLKGKRVMDVGSGLGMDGITFAENGAQITFVDIVDSNLEVLRRLCRIKGLSNVGYYLLTDYSSIDSLPSDFDVIWCQGSMINAPFEAMRVEAAALLKHLPVGGRWIELAYPKVRWEREGRLPFSVWGEHTDGPGTPWMEWYDTEKLLARLQPATFEQVLAIDFHSHDFNWFDLIRRS